MVGQKETAMSGNGKSHNPCGTLIYDGACRVCVATTHSLRRLEWGSIQFIPYDSKAAVGLLGCHYESGVPITAYFIDAQGTLHTGVEAFLPFLSRLPFGAVCLHLWQYSCVRYLASAAYRIFARNRYRWFGKAEQEHPPSSPF